MDRYELEHLRDQLMERRDFLAHDHSARLAEVSHSADHVLADELDLASEAADFDVTVHTAFRDGEEMDAILKALQKIDNGSYGRCEECSKDIPAKRLQALPFVFTCIDCQRQLEKNGGFARSAFRDQDYAFDDDSE